MNQVHYLEKEIAIQEIKQLLELIKAFPIGKQFSMPSFFVLDYTTRKYPLLTGRVQEIIGHHPRDFLDGGIDFVIDIFHKDDFVILNEKMFSTVVEYFKTTPHHQHQQYIFSHTYRLTNNLGKLVTILQKGSYITDEKTNLPLYSFGFCMDITSLKNDSCMVQTIDKYDKDKDGYNYYNITTNYYYPDPSISILTKREIEILLHMGDGLSSKQIADKLWLSENTVMNHRKNMLRKTNTKNVAELIAYAFKNKII